MPEPAPDTAAILRQNEAQYEDYYDKPDWWFRFRYDTQVKRKTCLHLVRAAGKPLSGQSVLEIGFGSGATLFSFAPDCSLYGVELSHSAIAHATSRSRQLGYAHTEFREVNPTGLTWPDASFDIVIASHVLEHVAGDSALLAEIRRVLKPNGIAVILIPINEHYADPNHVHRYSPASFAALAAGTGLRTVLQEENELLFHLVERFYFEGYSRRWHLLGPIIAALFNFPTSLLSYSTTAWIDRRMRQLGYLPRQAGFVLAP